MKYGIWLGLALLTGATCCGVSGAADGILARISEKQLQQAAVRAQTERTRGMTILDDSGLSLFLDAMIDRLWMQAHSDQPIVRVYVVQDAIADAFTYPDGAIYLTTGMIAQTRSADQLALILAHEIIHYTGRHALAVIGRSKRAAPPSAPRVPKQAQCREAVEQQADRRGIELMQRAGYCPQAAVMTAPQHRDGGSPVRQAALFKQRLAQVRDLLAQMSILKDSPSLPIDRREYTVHIASALLANARSGIRQGLWEQASRSIGRYLRVCSDDPEGFYLQGEIVSRAEKRTDLAISWYQKAIDLNRNFVPAYRAMGFLHFKAGRLFKARRFFETSLALAPQANENEYIREYLKLCHD